MEITGNYVRSALAVSSTVTTLLKIEAYTANSVVQHICYADTTRIHTYFVHTPSPSNIHVHTTMPSTKVIVCALHVHCTA